MTKSPMLRVLAILVVTAVALALHARAVALIPIDYDEDDYLAAAQRYAEALRAGDVAAVVNYGFNYEHPPLTKLAYGAVLLALPPAPEIPERPSTDPPVKSLPEPHFHWARWLSAAFGTLEALAVAVLNPLAGLLLGLHTWQIKYTSQIMLEPLPALTSALAAVFYLRWRKAGQGMEAGKGRPVWLALSGLALGLTAASKYTYCIVGVAIAVDWLWATRPEDRRPSTLARRVAPLIVWGLVAVVVFVAADPRLWNDGPHRLMQSVLYHADYAQSEHVKQAGYPAWQPLVWLAGPVPWHPGVFLAPLDLFITVLAVSGLRRLWERERVLALWLLLALAFLLVWTTKWPQYILILTAPLCASAAHGFQQHIAEPLGRWWRARREAARVGEPKVRQPLGRQLRDLGRAAPWLLPGVVVLALILGFPLIFQLAMALTDFNTMSIRDGINGGVWREVALGLTGQHEPVGLELFSGPRQATAVRYAGPDLLLQLFFGLGADVLVFNVLWMVLVLAFQTVVGVGAALLLNRPGLRFRTAWLAVLILPWAIPEYVGALVWLLVFYPQYGWLALAAGPQGTSLPSLTLDPQAALGYLLVAGTWYGFPLVMLAATAGLKLIPPHVYDAAAMDGAGGWRLFRHVTWPLIWPLLAPALIIRAIFAFNQFYLFYAMQTPFPAVTHALVSFYYFNQAGQYAVSAAINVFVVIVLIGLLLWFNRWSRAGEGVTYA